MKHFFVINPHSFRARGNMERVAAEINAVFADVPGGDYEIYISRFPRDAFAAIHRYASKFSQYETMRVYAVGGDGILFDCLNGMIDFPNAEITNIPYGTANDFIRAFGEKSHGEFRDIKKLTDAPAREIDVIRVGSNYAINQVGIGLEGHAVITAQQFMRRYRSKWLRPLVKGLYTFCSAAALLNGEVMGQKYHAVVDGEDVSGSYYNIHIASGACGGGRMVLDPYALPTSGTLGVIFGRSSGALTAARCIGAYTSGRFERHKMFFRKTFSKMEIKSGVPMRVHMDGEAFYTDETVIEIVPKRVKFFAPAGLDFEDYSHKADKRGAKKGAKS